MTETLTHWKKLHNPEYLGAYSLTPEQDLIVTISSVSNEMIVGAEGKKEECMVIRFKENNIKPMILNATNAKTITKLLKTPYIEKWRNCKIQLFVNNVKAFGEVTEALRIRNYLPITLTCADCGVNIQPANKMTGKQIAEYSTKKYGRALCITCGVKAKEATQLDEGVL